MNDDKRTGVTPRRWLVVQAHAVLESVATSNYACYGRQGVPRYPVPRTAQQQPAEPVLCVELHISAPDGSSRLALVDLELARYEQTDRYVVWQTYDAGRRLQVIWTWDFYRILSHVALRFGLPDGGQASDALWQSVLDTARAIDTGDTIALRVQSRCGSIDQRHTITERPHEWAPASQPAEHEDSHET